MFDAASERGRCATTLGGAGDARRWNEYVERFTGKENVYVCADNDDPGREPGREAEETAARALRDAGITDGELYVVDFSKRLDGSDAPKKYDVADLIAELEAAEADPRERFRKFQSYLDGARKKYEPTARAF